MSLDLPDELVWAISFIGLPWPQVEEDQLHEYAAHLRTYAAAIADAHGGATANLRALGADWSGDSYEALLDRWSHASGHIHEVVDVCHGFADAMDVAADAVFVAKAGIIVALTAMVAEFVAEQAAAVATFGLAEFANVAIVGSTRFIVKGLLDQLEQAAIAEALQVALTPLQASIEKAVSGLVLHELEAALS
jgi:hypothetical protein